MAPKVTQQTLDICAKYTRALNSGEDRSAVVGYLASEYDVQRPAIWKALRKGGVIPPYRPREDGGKGRPVGGGKPGYTQARREASDARKRDREVMNYVARVDRDPCPRCGIRRDIGCNHSRAPLGMML